MWCDIRSSKRRLGTSKMALSGRPLFLRTLLASYSGFFFQEPSADEVDESAGKARVSARAKDEQSARMAGTVDRGQERIEAVSSRRSDCGCARAHRGVRRRARRAGTRQ